MIRQRTSTYATARAAALVGVRLPALRLLGLLLTLRLPALPA